MAKILLVEDEVELSAVVSEWLKDEQYVVDAVHDGERAISLLGTEAYDLVILDVMLPHLNGIEVCKRFRSTGSSTPVLMLTARASISDKENGLDSGADDYLTKPFHLRELSARVRALLRRPQVAPISSSRFGNLVLDRNSCAVVRNGNEVIQLHPREFSILEFFMRHPRQLFSADDLIDRIWGVDSNIVPETVRTYIKTLRRKIDPPGARSFIQNIRGMGYKIEDHDA